MKPKAPSADELPKTLGPAKAVWDGIISAVAAKYSPLAQEWKPSKSDFGFMCLLKQKKRTLLYLTPDAGKIRIAIVLGERAVAIALASELPAFIRKLISEARPYAEGRGIRFDVSTADDVSLVAGLVDFKTTPK
ncbi:MAG TPA: DUF3788 family protein [Planctomycetota bacterium]|jgi:hypothetical protein